MRELEHFEWPFRYNNPFPYKVNVGGSLSVFKNVEEVEAGELLLTTKTERKKLLKPQDLLIHD